MHSLLFVRAMHLVPEPGRWALPLIEAAQTTCDNIHNDADGDGAVATSFCPRSTMTSMILIYIRGNACIMQSRFACDRCTHMNERKEPIRQLCINKGLCLIIVEVICIFYIIKKNIKQNVKKKSKKESHKNIYIFCEFIIKNCVSPLSNEWAFDVQSRAQHTHTYPWEFIPLSERRKIERKRLLFYFFFRMVALSRFRFSEKKRTTNRIMINKSDYFYFAEIMDKQCQ